MARQLITALKFKILTHSALQFEPASFTMNGNGSQGDRARSPVSFEESNEDNERWSSQHRWWKILYSPTKSGCVITIKVNFPVIRFDGEGGNSPRSILRHFSQQPNKGCDARALPYLSFKAAISTLNRRSCILHRLNSSLHATKREVVKWR